MFVSNGVVHVSYVMPLLDLTTLYIIYSYSVRIRGRFTLTFYNCDLFSLWFSKKLTFQNCVQLIPSLVCFSQSYYVHFIMSKDYRKVSLNKTLKIWVRYFRPFCLLAFSHLFGWGESVFLRSLSDWNFIVDFNIWSFRSCERPSSTLSASMETKSRHWRRDYCQLDKFIHVDSCLKAIWRSWNVCFFWNH